MPDQVRHDDFADVHLRIRKASDMIAAALALAAQLANPGFERGLEGWESSGHRGIGVSIGSNRGYTIRQSAEGEHYLNVGWQARNAAPPDAERRVFTRIDARHYRGRTIRVSAQTKAPDFAHRNARLAISADGAEAVTRIDASAAWRRHSVDLRVPRDAREIEIAFIVEGTRAELAIDDVRLELVRR
jgi:hypothetical protein